MKLNVLRGVEGTNAMERVGDAAANNAVLFHGPMWRGSDLQGREQMSGLSIVPPVGASHTLIWRDIVSFPLLSFILWDFVLFRAINLCPCLSPTTRFCGSAFAEVVATTRLP